MSRPARGEEVKIAGLILLVAIVAVVYELGVEAGQRRAADAVTRWWP